MRKSTSKDPARRSASFSKIGTSDSCDSFNVDGASTLGFRFIDIEILHDFMQEMQKSELHLEEVANGRSGLASTINVSCTECGESNMFQMSKISQRGMFEINEDFFFMPCEHVAKDCRLAA